MAAAKPETHENHYAILAVTDGGRRLAAQIAEALPGATLIPERTGLADLLVKRWGKYDGFIFIMAAGIVVRLIAPLIKDKKTDPGVVVLDEKGKFCISLLAGHLGGGNELAAKVAAATDGQPVITTASDTLGHTALDLWAMAHSLSVEDNGTLTRVSARLVNSGVLRIFSQVPVASLPDDLLAVAHSEEADCIVSHQRGPWPKNALLLYPKNLVVGIGCNRGTGREQIETALSEALEKHNLAESAIRNLASIDLKQDETGLLALAAARDWRIDFYNKEQLNSVAGISRSEAVLRATGAVGVAEPAACLSADTNNLLVRKMKWPDVTIAIAQAPFTLSEPGRAA